MKDKHQKAYQRSSPLILETTNGSFG